MKSEVIKTSALLNVTLKRSCTELTDAVEISFG